MNAKLCKILVTKGFWSREAAELLHPQLKAIHPKFSGSTHIQLCETSTARFRRGFMGLSEEHPLEERAFVLFGGTFYLSYYYDEKSDVLFIYAPALENTVPS